MSSRDLAKSTESAAGKDRVPPAFAAGLIRPGIANIRFCYLLTLTVFLSPLALLFSILYATQHDNSLHAHYFYLRTTNAILVIGFSLGCLLVILGASLSTGLILAGLAVLSLTALWTMARCGTGLFSAFRNTVPRNHTSYFF